MISYIDNVKNVVTEVPITIAASSWSSSAPYTYTWTDSRVLAGSSVDVDILATTVDTSVISLDYEKAVGSVTFTANVKPTANIAVTIRIINARADLGTSISADTIATDNISGASNVNQALEVLSNAIITNGYDNTSKIKYIRLDWDANNGWHLLATDNVSGTHIFRKSTQLYIKSVTGTTTSTGAITPGIDISIYYIISAAFTSTNANTGFVLWRGKDGYLHCFNADMTIMANTSVKLQVVYCRRSELVAG